MARTSNFANVASITRASISTDAGGWDFQSGSVVGAISDFAANTIVQHPTRGFLVEAVSNTNGIENPRAEGGTAGTLGTDASEPTNWSVGNNADGATISFGTANGWEYMEIDFGDMDPGGNVDITFNANSEIDAVQNDDVTLSIGAELTRGDLTNFNTLVFLFQERTSSGSNISATLGSENILSTLDTNHRRYFDTHTMAEATAGHIRFGVRFTAPSGNVDAAIRLYVPMGQVSSFVSSPIRPTAGTPAAATRDADVIYANAGAFFDGTGASSFSFRFLAAVITTSANQTIISVGPDTDDRNQYRVTSSAALQTVVRRGGANEATYNVAGLTVAEGSAYSVAARVESGDHAMSATGGTQATNGNATSDMSDPQIWFGNASGSNQQPCQTLWIENFKLYPYSLTDAQLEALVGN